MMPLLRQPLIRLLAVNLLGGAGVAVLMLGGLLALNPTGLRELMLADRDAGAALALLAFGLIVTFGSAAMGSAVMALGSRDGRGGRFNAPGLAPRVARLRDARRLRRPRRSCSRH